MDNYTPPTDEQLVNFICVTAFGPGATQAEKDVAGFLLTSQAGFKDIWLARHRDFQEQANKGALWATEGEISERDQRENDQEWEDWFADMHVERKEIGT